MRAESLRQGWADGKRAVCLRFCLRPAAIKPRLSGPRSPFTGRKWPAIRPKPARNTVKRASITGVRFDAGLQHVVQIGTTRETALSAVTCASRMACRARKCSNCEQSRDLHYWSLENEQAAVKASCGDCGTYLKILYPGKRRKWKPWPDDLARWCWTRAWSRKGSPQFHQPFLFRGKGNKFLLQTGRSLPSVYK
ncbi:formate dehydrogenase accessory protein FdhE [Salmonella enterica subsp. enterica]|nr:formate dehydrogenase accessory protein FdhE [Salmonella enterica subsp. enterica]